MADPLHPSPSLLCKLGSLIVHFEEANDRGGHLFDRVAIDSLEADSEVQEWIVQMEDLALIPRKRFPRRQ